MDVKKFNEFLEGGGQLSYQELRDLNSVKKDEYVKRIVSQNNFVTAYINEQK